MFKRLWTESRQIKAWVQESFGIGRGFGKNGLVIRKDRKKEQWFLELVEGF